LKLQRMISSAQASNKGRAILVMFDGPAGVGKTYFTDQVERHGNMVAVVHRDDYSYILEDKNGRTYTGIDWRHIGHRIAAWPDHLIQNL